ncbi:MAG: dienelactone hydrolase family protein [Verrucomicrobiota bacterium]
MRLLSIALVALTVATTSTADTFTPFTSGPAPDNVPALWHEYDPAAEPLDVEVVKEWEVDNTICRYVIFTVGTFKNTPARIAAYYTFPKGHTNGPAFVWCHGGGQRADLEHGLYFAKHGYAVLDINWGGRPMEDDISKHTNWGKVDPSQGPRFYPGALRDSTKPDLLPDKHTIDPIPSPRNSSWFLLAVAGRRAITFLEQQPEVDPSRIGFTGYSMGGTVTSMVAIDPRLKAVAPMVGGTGWQDIDFPGLPGTGRPRCRTHPELYANTIDSRSYWPHVSCPVLFLNSSNDFHATFERVYQAMDRLPHDNWRVSQNLHASHSPNPEQWILLNRWFDQYLKHIDQHFPKTAQTNLEVDPATSTATFTVNPDQVTNLDSLVVYYTHDPNSRSRFWYAAEPTRSGDSWTAQLPLRPNLPLFAFAQCTYPLDSPMESLRGPTPTFSLTSTEGVYIPDSLDIASLTTDANFAPTFEDFAHGWRDWSRSREGGSLTYKFRDPAVDFTHGKALAIEVDFPKAPLSFRVRVSKNKYISNIKAPIISYAFTQQIKEPGPQRIVIHPTDLTAKDEPPMTNWSDIYSLHLTIYDGETQSSLDLHGPHKDIVTRMAWLEED